MKKGSAEGFHNGWEPLGFPNRQASCHLAVMAACLFMFTASEQMTARVVQENIGIAEDGSGRTCLHLHHHISGIGYGLAKYSFIRQRFAVHLGSVICDPYAGTYAVQTVERVFHLSRALVACHAANVQSGMIWVVR